MSEVNKSMQPMRRTQLIAKPNCNHHNSTPNIVRHDVCRHNYAEERGLVVGFCGHPNIRQPGFDLPRHTWSLINRFRTGQGLCRAANLHKWGLAQSPSCDCGQRQTMNHIVDTCPLTKCEGGVNLLHEADDDAVIRLESTATAALVK